jgi:hypothetical protein
VLKKGGILTVENIKAMLEISKQLALLDVSEIVSDYANLTEMGAK